MVKATVNMFKNCCQKRSTPKRLKNYWKRLLFIVMKCLISNERNDYERLGTKTLTDSVKSSFSVQSPVLFNTSDFRPIDSVQVQLCLKTLKAVYNLAISWEAQHCISFQFFTTLYKIICNSFQKIRFVQLMGNVGAGLSINWNDLDFEYNLILRTIYVV